MKEEGAEDKYKGKILRKVDVEEGWFLIGVVFLKVHW